MKTENIKKVADLLSKNTQQGIDFLYHLKDQEFTTVDEIRDILQDAGAFDIEIIYYSTAIKFLQENDPSLRESLELASDFGFELKNLNSEILASLLASRYAAEEFEECTNKLESLLEEIAEEETEKN